MDGTGVANMTRRTLLAMLTGATLDPERALWVPGKRHISIPKVLSPRELDLVLMGRLWEEFVSKYGDSVRFRYPQNEVKMFHRTVRPLR